jgi:hypothetical protein
VERNPPRRSDIETDGAAARRAGSCRLAMEATLDVVARAIVLA